MKPITDSEYITILEQLRIISQNEDTNEKIVRILINRTLRKYTEERPPTFISNGAQILAKEKNVELVIIRHSHIHKPIKQGVLITLEHCTPVNELVDQVLDGKVSIADILENNITAIVTRVEDKKLNSAGYRLKRPGGYIKCYTQPGIDIVLTKYII
jgi:hypothetical protein